MNTAASYSHKVVVHIEADPDIARAACRMVSGANFSGESGTGVKLVFNGDQSAQSYWTQYCRLFNLTFAILPDPADFPPMIKQQ